MVATIIWYMSGDDYNLLCAFNCEGDWNDADKITTKWEFVTDGLCVISVIRKLSVRKWDSC